MREYVVNKKGHVDVRNALGAWSVFKEVFDVAFIVFGGGTMLEMPNIDLTSFIFLIWLWSIIKVTVDTPLAFMWLAGKIAHVRRKNRRKRNAKASKS